MKYPIVIIFLLTAILLAGCEKNSDDTKAQRIKELILNYAGESNDNKKVFTYENDRLVLIKNYKKNISGSWEEYSKDTITYSGENATCVDFALTDGGYELRTKVDYTISNKKITREAGSRYDEDTWKDYWRTEYQYEGNNIKQWFFYLDYIMNGTLYAYSRSDLSYKDGKIQSVRQFSNMGGSWSPSQKDSFCFAGNQLTSVICYRPEIPDSWQEYYRDDFEYLNDKVSESNRTYHNSINPATSCDYVFDENGYCISVTDDEQNTFTYQYEDGSGNAGYFFYAPLDYYIEAPRLKLIGMGLPQIAPYKMDIGPK